MDADEHDLVEARAGESPAAFKARLRLLDRAGPILARLADEGFTVIVEGERRSTRPGFVEADYVLEYGDVRVRILLFGDEENPLRTLITREQLQHFFVDVPDTDAVAVVADDDVLSTEIVDIYDANDPSAPPVTRRPLLDAIGAYFNENVFAVELPDFRAILEPPAEGELRRLLVEAVGSRFDRVKSARARIEEKIAALDGLSPLDRKRISNEVLRVLESEHYSLTELLGRPNGDGDD